MKSTIIAILLYTVQIGGIIYGTYWGQKEFLNLALWAVWISILLCLFGLFIPSKDFYKTKQKNKLMIRCLSLTLMLILVITGHFIAGTAWMICWILLYLKGAIYKDELAKSDSKTTDI